MPDKKFGGFHEFDPVVEKALKSDCVEAALITLLEEVKWNPRVSQLAFRLGVRRVSKHFDMEITKD